MKPLSNEDERPRSAGVPFLTAAEAGQRLGTGERFVRRLIAERRIPFHKMGALVRISEVDLVAFIEAGRVEVGRVEAER